MGDSSEDIDVGQMAALMFKNLTPGGPHAFGWMSWSDGDDAVQYQRRPGRADTLDNLEWIYTVVEKNPRWFVGHTRWATHGSAQNNINNHPILHDGVIGVHNGVLQNHKSILEQTGRIDSAAEVDSEAIFAAVNKWGPLNGIRKIEGDMVSIWNVLTDMETLYIARTEGRFLHLAWTDRGNLIFASQPSAIEILHPLVRIVKWSVVDQQKLLRIKNGRVIHRTKIRDPRPKAPVAVRMAGDKFAGEFFAAQGVAAQKRGSRRGEAMFPKTTVEEMIDRGKVSDEVQELLRGVTPEMSTDEVKDRVVANVRQLSPAQNQNGSPKSRPKKASEKVAEVKSEHWVPDIGMFADDEGNLRPASQEEAAFFGWDPDDHPTPIVEES